ncbi:MAG: hypothetical protein U9P00_03240, partial [Pseudomonadota bacterium]|nr:hypothetical protein [Pseudomonadota bacterium]
MLFLAAMLAVPSAMALTVNVVGPDGTTPVTGFKWLVQEDQMKHHDPGVTCARTDPVLAGTQDIENCSSVQFHSSYMPVVAEGFSDTDSADLGALDPAKHYYVSILPYADFNIGGTSVAPEATIATVGVNPMPIPTAQITIFVFEDNFPTNNAPDLPEEVGLEGFTLILEDAGGRYGAAAGILSQDAFANPLGTTYLRNPDGTAQTDPDGLPIVDVLGDNVLTTDANGRLTVKNLAPGKYGVVMVAPQGTAWQQTTTIEGTKLIDAWVKADEPPFFNEFAGPGTHVFMGFVLPTFDTDVLGTGST